jgi:hypothetical protein
MNSFICDRTDSTTHSVLEVGSMRAFMWSVSYLEPERTRADPVVSARGVQRDGQWLVFDPPGKPSVLGLSQQAGAAGAPVTIFGNNFGTSGSVTFNGTTATTTQWTNNSITAMVPMGATSGPVVVTVSSKQSNNNNTFTVLSGQTLQFLVRMVLPREHGKGCTGLMGTTFSAPARNIRTIPPTLP